MDFKIPDRLKIREKVLSNISKYRLVDNEFMRAFFEDYECTAELLRIILNKKVKVLRVTMESALNVTLSRSVRLDILVVDELNRIYNIEIQRSDSGAAPKRARLNSSIIDSKLLNSGEKFDVLPDTYVIFITEGNPLKGDKALYHIERYITEDGRPFDDGSHIIYFSLSAATDGELADLQHDFYCTDPQEMKNHILAKRADALKNTDKGVNKMSEIMEQLIREVNIENQKAFDELTMKMELEKAKAAEEKAKAAEEKAKAAEEKARAEAAEEKARAKAAEEKARADAEKSKADAEKLRAEAAEEKLLNYQRAFKLSNDMRRMGIPESEISRSIEEAFGIAA